MNYVKNIAFRKNNNLKRLVVLFWDKESLNLTRSHSTLQGINGWQFHIQIAGFFIKIMKRV